MGQIKNIKLHIVTDIKKHQRTLLSSMVKMMEKKEPVAAKEAATKEEKGKEKVIENKAEEVKEKDTPTKTDAADTTVQLMAGDLKALPVSEKNQLLLETKNAFNFRRRVEIHGLPPGIPEVDVA